ncbi:hypothetical protein ACJMK2_029320 [Sinanodonta woodiana]|uniref:SPRY domain-containing protein n=1 Tax=Sinanodonta woodiana TaxID=1069815 RepID=A0ABD3XBA5_SINWO
MTELFRCAGDILFDNSQPIPGLITDVLLKQHSETSNFLQYMKPLSKNHSYFFAQIRSMSAHSKITIGIAGPDIDNDAHPGHWNNTVGYHSDTGKCYTSHKCSANTRGEKFGIGDMFGVQVTHFGKEMSTVVFVKNGVPVATRYLFQSDHSRFLPTICLEYGPIDMGIMWLDAPTRIPRFSERNMLHWIKHRDVQYDVDKNVFFYDKKEALVTVQSPQSLSKDFSYYEVILHDTSEIEESVVVGMGSCSPIHPTPTCALLRDFFSWKADGNMVQVKSGMRVGLGVHYNPKEVDKPDFDDKEAQLVLCVVTINSDIAAMWMLLQPPGGFYPLVILCRNVSIARVDVESLRQLRGNATVKALLDKSYWEKYENAMNIVLSNLKEQELSLSLFRKSKCLVVKVSSAVCQVCLPAKHKKIHVIQLQQPLTHERPYYFIEIKKLNEESVISFGVADSNFPLDKHIGKVQPSTGWYSKEGKFYQNLLLNGNTHGERFGEGNTVGLEMRSFDTKAAAVVFIKNNTPIGTRYVTLPRAEEFFPTIAICGNGYDVELDVTWQTHTGSGPNFNVSDLEFWCRPSHSCIDEENNILICNDHLDLSVVQCPYSFSSGFNHFEIRLLDKVGDNSKVLPPIIGLTGPGILEKEKNQTSQLRMDVLRIWAPFQKTIYANDFPAKAVNIGDQIGWGMHVPQSEMNKMEPLVICYLTINQDIVITRVMYEPLGGFHPIVFLPPEVNRVQFVLSNLYRIETAFTVPIEEKLLEEARQIERMEQDWVQNGNELDNLNLDPQELIKPFFYNKNGNEAAENLRFANIAAKANTLENVKKKYRDAKESAACTIL